MTAEKIYEMVITYWLQFGLGCISAYLVYYVKTMSKRNALEAEKRKKEAEAQELKQEAIEAAMLALLRNAIISSYNKNMDRNVLMIHERDNVLALHTQYKNLKGNGVVDHLLEELMELPTQHREPNK